MMPEPESSSAIRLVAFGLRLRVDAVAHFLAESRAEPGPHSLSAAAFHASSLRQYAAAAPGRLRSHSPEGGS